MSANHLGRGNAYWNPGIAKVETEKLRLRLAEKQDQATRLIEKYFKNECTRDIYAVFQAWVNVRQSNGTNDKFKLKALAMLAGKETKLLCEEIFRTWKTFVQSGATKMRRARGAMTALIGGQRRLMMQNVWKGWCDIVLELKKDKITERRMLTVMFNNDAQALSACMFQAWSQLVVDDKKKSQAHLRTMAAFASGNVRFMVTEGFNAFVKYRENAMKKRKQEKALQLEESLLAANEAIARARAKSLASMQRMCAHLAGACAGAFFGAWKQVIADERGSSKLAERMAFEESMRHTAQLQAAQAMMGKTGKMWQTRCLAAWIKEHDMLKHEKAACDVSAERKEAAHRLLGIFAGNKSTVLLTRVIVDWRRVAHSLAGIHDIEKIHDAHREEKEVMMLKANVRTFIWAQRLLAKVFAQDRESTLSKSIQVWRESVICKANAGSRRGHAMRVLAKAIEGNASMTRRLVFSVWRTLAGAKKDEPCLRDCTPPRSNSAMGQRIFWYSNGQTPPPITPPSSLRTPPSSHRLCLGGSVTLGSTQCSSGSTTPLWSTIRSGEYPNPRQFSAPQFGIPQLELSANAVTRVPSGSIPRSVTPPAGWRA